MANHKSNEYALRKEVVKKLLSENWMREDIRIEIPLSTASADGRADIVCIGDDFLGAVELKSGKDKFCPAKLKAQIEPYKRAFDYCATVVDSEHYRRVETVVGLGNHPRVQNNFNNVDVIFHYNYWKFKGEFRDTAHCQEPVEHLTPSLFRGYRRSGKTSSRDMAAVMWKDELCKALGNKNTRSHNIDIVRREYGADKIRPLLMQALRDRPLNDWEITFWEKYDQEIADEKTGK